SIKALAPIVPLAVAGIALSRGKQRGSDDGNQQKRWDNAVKPSRNRCWRREVADKKVTRIMRRLHDIPPQRRALVQSAFPVARRGCSRKSGHRECESDRSVASR